MKIFIWYRWADSKYAIDRIRARFMAAYSVDAIFLDIENIPPGLNFSGVSVGSPSRSVQCFKPKTIQVAAGAGMTKPRKEIPNV